MRLILVLTVLFYISCHEAGDTIVVKGCLGEQVRNNQEASNIESLERFEKFGSQPLLKESGFILINWEKDLRGFGHFWGECFERVNSYLILIREDQGEYFCETIVSRSFDCNYVAEYQKRKLNFSRWVEIENILLKSNILCLESADRIYDTLDVEPLRGDGYSVFYSKENVLYSTEENYLGNDLEIDSIFGQLISNVMPRPEPFLWVGKHRFDDVSVSSIQLGLRPIYKFKEVVFSQDTSFFEKLGSQKSERYLSYSVEFECEKEGTDQQEHYWRGDITAILYDESIVKILYSIHLFNGRNIIL
ncbi:MAG: hypothetical protein KDC34_19265 [Saprospiraceae bacterium]|nr:hypothetical protein [Saprospiraceae bacterium]